MSRLLGILFLVIIVIAGVGFARGWFTISSNREDATNRVDVNLSVDSDKIRQDTDTAKREAREFTEETAETFRGVGDSIDEAQTNEVPVEVK